MNEKTQQKVHFDGLEVDDMITVTQRLRAMTDQSSARLVTWIVAGNAASLAFCMSNLVRAKITDAIWWPLIFSSWAFIIGLGLGIVGAFQFTRAMSEYSIHSQEVVRGMRKGKSSEELFEIGTENIKNADSATVIAAYASVISAVFFGTGILGGLWSATTRPFGG